MANPLKVWTLRRRRRWTTELRPVVALVLTTSFALLPLLQGLHTRFSEHDHHYCPAHRQIEEGPRERPPSASRPEAFDPGVSAFRADDPAPLASAHAACAIMNGSSLRDPVDFASACRAYGRPVDRSSVRPFQRIDVPSLSLLSTAPKQSPPVPVC